MHIINKFESRLKPKGLSRYKVLFSSVIFSLLIEPGGREQTPVSAIAGCTLQVLSRPVGAADRVTDYTRRELPKDMSAETWTSRPIGTHLQVGAITRNQLDPI